MFWITASKFAKKLFIFYNVFLLKPPVCEKLFVVQIILLHFLKQLFTKSKAHPPTEYKMYRSLISYTHILLNIYLFITLYTFLKTTWLPLV